MKYFEHAFTFIMEHKRVVSSGPNPGSGGWDGQFLSVPAQSRVVLCSRRS